MTLVEENVMDKVFISLKNAYTGLKYCFATQRNMVIHAFIGFVVLITALLLNVPLNGMLFLITAIMVVLVAEALNTALEQAIDLFTKERNQFAHNAKDIAAGAVLLASAFAVLVGLFILGPPLWYLLIEIF